MKLDLSSFQGAIPKVEPHLLPDQVAQHALNCRLETGAIEALNAASLVTSLAKGASMRSVYRWGGTDWLHWANLVTAIRGPIAQDTEERTYFTGDGVPKMTYAGKVNSSGDGIYPSTAYDLGVPAPTAAPTLSGVAASTDETTDTRAYIYTYVTSKGEEGPPSPAELITVATDANVTVTTPTSAPTGNYDITHKRVYRTNKGAGESSYQYVGEVPIATADLLDNVDSDNLGEFIPSLDWYKPPSDLDGLLALPIGSLAGFSKNELCLTPPNYPHAWPFAYRYAVDYPIKALGRIDSAVVILTSAEPFIAHVTDPAAVAPSSLEKLLPCVSRESVVSMGHAVLYASVNGLVSIAPSGATLITEKLFTRREWAALKPSSMRAYRFDDRYLCFYDTGTEQGGFILDASGREFTFIDQYFNGGWADPETGDLFLIKHEGLESKLYQWDAGTPLTFQWTSKNIRLKTPANLGAFRVRASAYPVHLKVWADGVLKYDKDVADDEIHTLPGGFLAKEWKFELSGTKAITMFEIAESAPELRGE